MGWERLKGNPSSGTVGIFVDKCNSLKIIEDNLVSSIECLDSLIILSLMDGNNREDAGLT